LQLDAAAADWKPDAVAADWRVDVAATAAGTRPAATAAETVYCSDGGCRGLQRWGGVACREGGGDRVLLRRRRQRQCTGWKTVVADLGIEGFVSRFLLGSNPISPKFQR
jgi:hypothetical protein